MGAQKMAVALFEKSAGRCLGRRQEARDHLQLDVLLSLTASEARLQHFPKVVKAEGCARVKGAVLVSAAAHVRRKRLQRLDVSPLQAQRIHTQPSPTQST